MTDAWPRRNLGRSEQWGRTVERRVEALGRSQTITDQTSDGYGRYTTATFDTLSQIADDVERAVSMNPHYFSLASSAQGFGFGGDDWFTVASITAPNTRNFWKGEISAVGTISSLQDSSPVARFIWPFSLDDVSSEYGPRPPLPFHNGIDFAYPGISGAPIPATHDGTIILRAYYSDWGNYTRIDCSAQTGVPGSWTGYAHMTDPGIYPVGVSVTQGQTIGYVGSSGFVTGAHLHYETAPAGDRINPRTFMDIFGGTLGSYVSVEARILINGVASPVFQPYTQEGIGANQLNFPLFGRSIENVGSGMRVDLQLRAPGGSISPSASQKATLSIQGGFQ